MNNKLTPANIVILASGAVILVFSFFDFFKGADSGLAGDFFPLSTLVVICGVAMAVVVALKAFANVSLPEQVFGFSWPQIHFALAGLAAFIMLGFLFVDAGDKGVGFIFMLFGAAGLVVGAVLLLKEEGVLGIGGGGNPGYGQQPPPPGGYPPPPGPGYPPQGGPGQPPSQF